MARTFKFLQHVKTHISLLDFGVATKVTKSYGRHQKKKTNHQQQRRMMVRKKREKEAHTHKTRFFWGGFGSCFPTNAHPSPLDFTLRHSGQWQNHHKIGSLAVTAHTTFVRRRKRTKRRPRHLLLSLWSLSGKWTTIGVNQKEREGRQSCQMVSNKQNCFLFQTWIKDFFIKN